MLLFNGQNAEKTSLAGFFHSVHSALVTLPLGNKRSGLGGWLKRVARVDSLIWLAGRVR